jgi:predicted Zn finger-like uncharacterized protein
VVVICPKCKVRLRIPDEKVSPEGSRFRCPKCDTVLLVKRPVKAKTVNRNLVLVAHADEGLVERVSNLLRSEGYDVISVRDGIEAMVKSLRELPFLVALDVALPKIYGFEVCKRIKERAETKGIKVILITSVYDNRRYKRPPTTLYGADDYLEETEVITGLIAKIKELKEGVKKEEVKEEVKEPPRQEEVSEPPPVSRPQVNETDRARRLARTVLSDLNLYNPEKVREAIREGAFKEAFASQLSEGMKLYQQRISQEVRDQGDFFNEEVEKFVDMKRKEFE